MAARTVRSCLRHVQKQLTVNSVEEAFVNAKYLVAHAVGEKTLNSVKLSQKVSPSQWQLLKQITEKKISGTPIQYIVGDWDFRYITLQMKSPVFIPRPEGEVLISDMMKSEDLKHACTFLEVGSGTGALALSLLHENERLRAVAIDVNRDACELTEYNAKQLGLTSRITVINADINGFSKRLGEMGIGKFDFLISNPPYITSEDMESLPDIVCRFEDYVALHGGIDGLDVIRDILDEAPNLLHPKGTLWLEVDTKHPQVLQELIGEGSWKDITYVKTIPDMRNMSRFCQLCYDGA